MAKTIRILLMGFAGLANAYDSVIGALRDKARGIAVRQPETERRGNFFVRLRQDPEFRTRFSADPAAAVRELGLDPALFNMPDRLGP